MVSCVAMICILPISRWLKKIHSDLLMNTTTIKVVSFVDRGHLLVRKVALYFACFIATED